ncbi:MAG: hypothetical protein WA060_03535 [Minisyncoccia bacterium]
MKPENKQLLIVFGIGAALAILFPSFVNVPMVFIALAITLLIQRFNKKKVSNK